VAALYIIAYRKSHVIPALGRLRQEDGEFKAILGYTVIPYLKKKLNKQLESKIII
jgi:hypothetical protein